VINLLGALLVILAMPGVASDSRIASAWALVQFITGVWAGVLGANSPFLHGLVAGFRRCCSARAASPMPAQFVIVTWALVPGGRAARRGRHAVHATKALTGDAGPRSASPNFSW
jgi:hypothetical protein